MRKGWLIFVDIFVFVYIVSIWITTNQLLKEVKKVQIITYKELDRALIQCITPVINTVEAFNIITSKK